MKGRFEYCWIDKPPGLTGHQCATILNDWGAGGWRVVHWTNVGWYLEREKDPL